MIFILKCFTFMGKRFIIKKRQERKPSVPLRSPAPVKKLRADEGDDNAVKDNKNMDIKEKAARIEEIMQNPEANTGRVKRVKKDKGLRISSSLPQPSLKAITGTNPFMRALSPKGHKA